MRDAPVIAYVTEEVWRQGHDVLAVDGIQRVAWMLDAWVLASLWEGPITLDRIIQLGQRVERLKNAEGLRTCAVRVGPHVCPSPEQVRRTLPLLLEQQRELEPIAFYKELELIHPFVDGNGRTGKILMNYLNHTLHRPIFPPADLFGSPIRNP